MESVPYERLSSGGRVHYRRFHCIIIIQLTPSIMQYSHLQLTECKKRQDQGDVETEIPCDDVVGYSVI